MDGDQIADLRVEMTACRVDKEGRLDGLEGWKKEQNGELKQIRRNISGILIAVILLLVGVVANLVVDRSQPDIYAIVEQVIESFEAP